MAKGKFAALAEFRQQPDFEPETEAPVAPEAAEALPATEVEAPEPIEPVAAQPERDDEATQARSVPSRPQAAAPRPRGRPPGKRSDPEWKLFSHFLKRTTQRQAAAILFEKDDGRDLSDVLQTLLEKWVAKQQAKI